MDTFGTGSMCLSCRESTKRNKERQGATIGVHFNLVRCWSYRVGCTQKIAKPHWHPHFRSFSLLLANLEAKMSAGIFFFFFVKFGSKFRAILMSLLEKSCLNCPAIGNGIHGLKAYYNFIGLWFRLLEVIEYIKHVASIFLIITDCILFPEWQLF